MNDAFAEAAERFATAPGINMVDLGIAFFLEYFAIVPLRLTRRVHRYVPLRHRVLMTPWTADLELIKHTAPEPVFEAMRDMDAAPRIMKQHPELAAPLRWIADGMDRRHAEIDRANRLSQRMLLLATVVHVLIMLAILRCSDTILIYQLLGGWLGAMILAMVICVANLHWGSRIGFRRTAG